MSKLYIFAHSLLISMLSYSNYRNEGRVLSVNRIYLTACNSSSIVKPIFYYYPSTGDIIFEDGRTLQEILFKKNRDIPENSSFLVNEEGIFILTSDNKKIKIKL